MISVNTFALPCHFFVWFELKATSFSVNLRSTEQHGGGIVTVARRLFDSNALRFESKAFFFYKRYLWTVLHQTINVAYNFYCSGYYWIDLYQIHVINLAYTFFSNSHKRVVWLLNLTLIGIIIDLCYSSSCRSCYYYDKDLCYLTP